MIGSLVPEWADLDPNTLGEPVKSVEVGLFRGGSGRVQGALAPLVVSVFAFFEGLVSSAVFSVIGSLLAWL